MIDKVVCPQCESEMIEQTSKFDGTNIDAGECIHDFECSDCGCLFQIYYQPVDVVIVSYGHSDNSDLEEVL